MHYSLCKTKRRHSGALKLHLGWNVFFKYFSTYWRNATFPWQRILCAFSVQHVTASKRQTKHCGVHARAVTSTTAIAPGHHIQTGSPHFRYGTNSRQETRGDGAVESAVQFPAAATRGRQNNTPVASGRECCSCSAADSAARSYF